MYLFVGLGNPGPQYANNRHNIGFMAIDEIIDSYGFSPEKAKFGGVYSEGHIDQHKVICFKPLTYMNKSGIPTAQIASFYKIPLDHIFVFHDDLDLVDSKVRVKQGGGSGGHNGLKSLDFHLGNDYWRVRIGIDHPGSKEQVTGYVLQNFSKLEMAWVASLVDAMADEAHLLISGNPNNFTSKVMQDLGK